MGWWDDLKNKVSNGLHNAKNDFFGGGADNTAPRAGLTTNANNATGFANTAQGNYNRGTAALGQSATDLRSIANGQSSVSAEQLRQGLQQNLAAQQSAAAGAAPMNSAMAARTAAIQSAHLGSALAGQQAVAGLQERQNAQQALAQLLLGQRGQDLQGTLGGYGAVNQAYGSQISQNGDKSNVEKYGPAIAAGANLLSDRTLKTDIADGDDKARGLLEGLKAYSYKYKPSVSKQAGEGEQLGVMAQDLEATPGLKHTVINTPGGKMVNGSKLAAALAATLPGLNKRLKALEGDED